MQALGGRAQAASLGRLTAHARGLTLLLPARWPWHGDYINALNRIRALPAAAWPPPRRRPAHPPPARAADRCRKHHHTPPRKHQRARRAPIA